MGVASVIGNHLADAKELSELVQAPNAPGALRHYKLMLYLYTGPVAFASQAILLPDGTQ